MGTVRLELTTSGYLELFPAESYEMYETCALPTEPSSLGRRLGGCGVYEGAAEPVGFASTGHVTAQGSRGDMAQRVVATVLRRHVCLRCLGCWFKS
jgi:hypothetical protein